VCRSSKLHCSNGSEPTHRIGKNAPNGLAQLLLSAKPAPYRSLPARVFCSIPTRQGVSIDP